jgi:hypothetical protein
MEYGIFRWNKECFVRTRTKAGGKHGKDLKSFEVKEVPGSTKRQREKIESETLKKEGGDNWKKNDKILNKNEPCVGC